MFVDAQKLCFKCMQFSVDLASVVSLLSLAQLGAGGPQPRLSVPLARPGPLEASPQHFSSVC